MKKGNFTYIAPGISKDEWLRLNLDDPYSPDWNRAIEIFNERIRSRYIEPADSELHWYEGHGKGRKETKIKKYLE
jgi:hypothetical protein